MCVPWPRCLQAGRWPLAKYAQHYNIAVLQTCSLQYCYTHVLEGVLSAMGKALKKFAVLKLPVVHARDS